MTNQNTVYVALSDKEAINQNRIWKIRKEQAATQVELARLRFQMTGHLFFERDADYWRKVSALSESYNPKKGEVK